MCDCLIVGFNDSNFEKYVNMVKSFGVDSGAFRDLDLALVMDGKKPYRALEILTRYYNEGRTGEPKRFHNVDFIWPTILYLGSYLTRRGFSFDYVNLFHLEKEKFKEKLLSKKILTVAITTTLYVIPDPILEIIEFVRTHNRTAKIIVGGPYVGNQLIEQDAAGVQGFFRLLGADIYVDSTEGEFALVSILKALKNGESLEGIPNVAYRNGDSYLIGPKTIESNPLEENPVDYGLFPRQEIGQFVSLRTAKSCPFSCSFCGFPQRAGKYKYVTVELVEKELNQLRDLGVVSTLTFLDDTFNVPKERFKEILRMMIRNRYGFRWNSFLRSDHSDDEAIGLMAAAGCDGVFLGVESGGDRMLQNMNKTARTKDYRRAIPNLKKSGIFTHANLVIGFPGETLETFQETFNFIEEVQPDTYRAQLWYADPVTPVWKKKTELGIKGSAFSWSHNTMDCHLACDLVEKMFLGIQNSIWLPQNGFELWSIYYLQRMGMSVPQIKGFLKWFNAIIRERLICPGKETVDPVLFENLKKSCHYEGMPAGIEDPTRFSASEYAHAEKFWAEEFGSRPQAPALFGQSMKETRTTATLYFKFDQILVDEVRNRGHDITMSILTAYGAGLARLKNRSCVNVVTDIGGAGMFPIRLDAFTAVNGEGLIRETKSKISRAFMHSRYASHILTNPHRMTSLGGECPFFESAYLVSKSASARGSRNGTDTSDYYPKLKNGLRLTLEIVEIAREVRARFIYDTECLARSEIESLVSSLKVLLKQNRDCQDPAGLRVLSSIEPFADHASTSKS